MAGALAVSPGASRGRWPSPWILQAGCFEQTGAARYPSPLWRIAFIKILVRQLPWPS